MTKSYAKDIQLLLAILRNQENIKNALERFGCNQNNLEQEPMAFDLCSFYMAQMESQQSCSLMKANLL